MKKTFKKIAAALMAATTLAVSMVGMGTNAADAAYTDSEYGSAGYGSWYYSLSVSSHTSSAIIQNNGTVSRYNTMELSLIHRNAIQYTVVQGTEKTSSGVTAPNEISGMGKAFGSHNILYSHGCKVMLYGSDKPQYSPVVETIYLTVGC